LGSGPKLKPNGQGICTNFKKIIKNNKKKLWNAKFLNLVRDRLGWRLEFYSDYLN
jgi:hypothetical protein